MQGIQTVRFKKEKEEKRDEKKKFDLTLGNVPKVF